ncbi:MAG: DEAD/DEAH box helicase [Deltaproteobacteria bacterium]|nr:DEAD/DEAH box helicase [Deltaproteobacteria bacterium]
MLEKDPKDPEIVLLGQHPVETTEQTFASLKLSEPVLQSITRVGFEHPTPIQLEVIPPALEGKDIIGLAQTGSGKTAAFVLPIAERLLHGKGLRGLILCPTREIALQTKAFLDLFGKHHNLHTVCVIGGVSMGPQIRDLQNNPDIIVATPGRLVDHMERGNVKLDHIEELVLDEADHMLDLGFLPQMLGILKAVPRERHTMMFSATMPFAIEKLARQFLQEPIRIDILPKGKAAEGITHRLYLVEQKDKNKCLLGLLNQELGTTLVFTRMKRDADWICQVLEKEGHPVDKIHSDRSQKERTDALQGFREGEHRILVATDIASRGIDVPGIQHIVNFNIPEAVEEYIHRAGRTARAGALGLVSTIATWMDKPMIQSIEKALDKPLPRCTVPGVEPYVEIKVRPAGRAGRRVR